MSVDLSKPLIACIEELTGIPVFPEQISVEKSSSGWQLSVYGSALCELPFEQNDAIDEEGMMEACMQIPRLAERLIRNKMAEFERRLEPFYEVIRGDLAEVIEGDALEMIEFDIVNLGYPSRHWETDREAERGFPDLALRVTNYDDFEWFYPLDPLADEDVEELIAEILAGVGRIQ